MKLASHNTFTYLPVKKWWLKPFKFMAQCQSKTLEEQYACGARVFDIRIAFNGLTPGIAHGLIEFEGNAYALLDIMNSFGEPTYCRVINERHKDYEKFRSFCSAIEQRCPNITFFGGNNKKDWKLLYDFNTKAPDIIDKYSSWNNDTAFHGSGWHLDDLFPRIYALAFNKWWRKKLGNESSYLMQDFVGVY